MALSRTESTWEINNHGRFINQFPPNVLKSIRQYERINKKFIDKKCLLCSTKYIYIYICVCVCVCVCVCEEKLKKRNDPKFDEFIKKVDVERFGINNLLQDFKFMKNVVKIAIDVWWNNRRIETLYKKRKFHKKDSFFFIHTFFPLLFYQTYVVISITLFMNLNSWRRLLQPKCSTSIAIDSCPRFSVGTYWYHFQSMRRCCQGTWTCLVIYRTTIYSGDGSFLINTHTHAHTHTHIYIFPDW